MPPRQALPSNRVHRQPQPSTSSSGPANIYTKDGGEDPIRAEEREFAVYALESFDIQAQLALQNNQTLARSRLRYLKKLAGLPEDKIPQMPIPEADFDQKEFEAKIFDIESDEEDEAGPSTRDRQKNTR